MFDDRTEPTIAPAGDALDEGGLGVVPLELYASITTQVVAQQGDLALQLNRGDTCILFRDGKEVDRFSGNQDINSVRERIEKVIAL